MAIKVKCTVSNCRYNNSGICYSESINVCTNKIIASSSDHTLCDTFKPRKSSTRIILE